MESGLERTSRPPSLRIENETRDRLPTDSMVTVPLSEFQPSPREIDRESKFSDIGPLSPVDSCGELKLDPKITTLDDEIGSRNMSEASSMRESTGSVVITDVDEVRDLDDTNSVDWVELEKSEELESKSDPTDDAVSLLRECLLCCVVVIVLT